jgi:hypothetical protein
MLRRLDPKLGLRNNFETVIMQYLKLTNMQVPNTESIKALSLASMLTYHNLQEQLKKGISIDDIIPPEPEESLDEYDGVNE